MNANRLPRLLLHRALPALLLAALILLVGGCVPSLNAFFTAKDVVTDPSLAGTWSNAETIWSFASRPDGKSYTLTIRDRAESAFVAHLVKLDGQLYLDLAPKDYKAENKEFYSVHLVPAHTLTRVRLEGDSLTINAMNLDKVANMLKADPKTIAHQFIQHEVAEEDIPLLLAPTPKLQAFINKHRGEIFADDGTTLTRVPKS